MDFIETTVLSRRLRGVVFPLAVVPQQANTLGDRRVGGHNHSGVAISPQILGRVKAEGRGQTEGTASAPWAVAPMRLSRVFQ